jgi:hypothetical protein
LLLYTETHRHTEASSLPFVQKESAVNPRNWETETETEGERCFGCIRLTINGLVPNGE